MAIKEPGHSGLRDRRNAVLVGWGCAHGQWWELDWEGHSGPDHKALKAMVRGLDFIPRASCFGVLNRQ